jgi:hypothetical protein
MTQELSAVGLERLNCVADVLGEDPQLLLGRGLLPSEPCQAVDALDLQDAGVLARTVHPVAELLDAVGVARCAPVAGPPVPGRQVDRTCCRPASSRRSPIASGSSWVGEDVLGRCEAGGAPLGSARGTAPP